VLAFITSVRHPLNSNDYARVWRLLEHTLVSVCSQTDPRFRVFVVVNQARPLALPAALSERVEIVAVGFPPPSPVRAAATDMEAIRLDRGTKYAAGVAAAAAHDPDWVMFFDADDFIAEDLVALLHRREHPSGWTLRRGWWLKQGRVSPLDNFWMRCGTSNILRADILLSRVAGRVRPDTPQPAIVEALDERFLKYILGSHKFTFGCCREIGRPLGWWLERSAMRTLDTGENHSDLQGEHSPSAMDHTDWPAVTPALARRFHLPAAHRPEGS
jgi:hypothetical protein